MPLCDELFVIYTYTPQNIYMGHVNVFDKYFIGLM
jgi:hypothetical protein